MERVDQEKLLNPGTISGAILTNDLRSNEEGTVHENEYCGILSSSPSFSAD